MDKNQINLTYIPNQFRVRCEFSLSAAQASPEPPPSLIQRAKEKLESEKEKGHVVFYRFFETRLNKMWHLLHQSSETTNIRVAVTLATGAPHIPGLKVEVKEGKKFLLSLETSSALQNIPSHLFKLTVGQVMRHYQAAYVPNPAQLHALFIRARQGYSINRVEILPPPLIPPLEEIRTKPYHIIPDPNTGIISIALFNIKHIVESKMIPQILSDCDRIAHVTMGAHNYLLQKTEIVRVIRSAYRGPERFGLDLPLVILAVLKKTAFVKKSLLFNEPHGLPKAKNPVVMERFSLETQDPHSAPKITDKSHKTFDLYVSPDRTQISIRQFNMQAYQSQSPTEIIDAIKHELKLRGVLEDYTIDHLPQMIQKAHRKETLAGLIVAQGSPPQSGKEPYLAPVYKSDIFFDPTIADPRHKHLMGGIRSIQNQTSVQKGQVIAKVLYHSDHVTGETVFGEEIPAVPTEYLDVRLEKGIRESPRGTFVALEDGIPQIDENDEHEKKTWTISLIPSLIHAGDVNLASGDIRFSGPIEIKGSVAKGATVWANDRVIVHGAVEGHVICTGSAQGSVTIHGGLLGEEAQVISSGPIEVDFIQNANIKTQSKLTVKRSILGGHIQCGGQLIATGKDSVIAGAKIIVFESIEAMNIGKPNGSPTRMTIGLKFQDQERIEHLTKRVEKLNFSYEKEAANLQTLAERKQSQLTPQKIQMIESLKKRAPRLLRALKKAERMLKSAEHHFDYNEDSVVMVHNDISQNCLLNINGKKIPLTMDYKSVKIVAQRVKGKYIVALEDDDNAA